MSESSFAIVPLPFTLSNAAEVKITGRCPSDCNSFEICLGSGRDYSSEIPLLVNPRFDQGEVVRNSKGSGYWESEERLGGFPFVKGAKFELQIITRPTHYQILVNGCQCYAFKHRLQKEKVKNVLISGDVALENVQFIPKTVVDTDSIRPLPFTLCDGGEIKITGFCPFDCNRFEICLGSGQDYSSEIPLLVNPRFDQGEVVRNSKESGHWASEERLGEFPFVKGAKFELQIITRPTHYQILVNGSPCYAFGHRLQKEIVRNVLLSGDVIVDSVQFIEKTAVETDPIRPLPFILSDGDEILITGLCPSDCNRFEICLGSGQDYSSEIPLLVNPRFDQGEVVRNSKESGSWASEDRHGGFPFVKGAKFELQIITRSTDYQILVNDSQCYTFEHRLPKEMVRNVLISGDVEVENVQFIEKNGLVNPSVPVTMAVPGGVLAPGTKVIVHGKPTADASRFNINLLDGDDFATSDLVLQVDMRFHYHYDKNILIFNHRKGGVFGKEQRNTEDFVFARDQRFELAVLMEEDGYVLEVSGKQLVSFEHRIKPAVNVSNVYIAGDVIIEKIFCQSC